MIKINCPVCDRPGIEAHICPNCETDLSEVRLLLELPPSNSVKKSKNLPQYLSSVLAIVILIMGLGLGYAANYLLSQYPSLTAAINTPIEITRNSHVTLSNFNLNCGSFYYKVQPGDYLWLIAKRFYGQGNLYPIINQNNPDLKIRKNQLISGEILIIPNLEENCRGHL
ncbi:MAG TPA: LysM peptidoglycan-binding domain-containing protein [Allocoleopsis sp.]